jgi:hypothetical protein
MNAPGFSSSLLRLPKPFLTSLLWAVPLHVLGLTAILVASAALYMNSVWNQGAWMILSAWFMLFLYLLAGLAGGVTASLLFIAHRVLDTVESAAHSALRQLPALAQTGSASMSIDEAQEHYTAILDRILGQTLGYIPLPAWLERLIRTSIHDAFVADFITMCRERGLSRIPTQEFRNWILARGTTFALATVHDQITIWQYALFGLAGLLAGMAWLLSHLVS